MTTRIQIIELSTEWIDIRETLGLSNETIQITNRGNNLVLLEESSTMPSEDNIGELLTTFSNDYATMVATYNTGFSHYARSAKGVSRISVQVI